MTLRARQSGQSTICKNCKKGTMWCGHCPSLQAIAQGVGFLPSQPLIESMGDNMAASIAQKSPYPTTVEAGKSYFWCACGLSKSQPFCDGSHKGSEFVPLKWEATVSQTVYFCGCKQAKGPPFCDGSHNRL